jgi:SRSO17 transposase
MPTMQPNNEIPRTPSMALQPMQKKLPLRYRRRIRKKPRWNNQKKHTRKTKNQKTKCKSKQMEDTQMKTTAGELRTKNISDLLERKETNFFHKCIPSKKKDSFLSPLSFNQILQSQGIDTI